VSTPQALSKSKKLKVGLMTGLAALVLTTCVAGVDQFPLSAEGGEERGGPLTTDTTEVPGRLVSQDELVDAPPLAEPAPAPGQGSAPVESVTDPAEELQPGPVEPAAEPVEFKKVKVHQPRLRLTAVHDRALQQIRKIDGVRKATAFQVGKVPVGERGTEVTVAAVDPQKFRVMTPEVTANEAAVWQRIVEGDAAFTHDTGNRLKAELGSFVPAGTEGYTLRVGAYASNGIPPVADALVAPDTARELGMLTRQDALVSLTDSADPEAVARQIRQVAEVNVEIIEEPQARRAFLTGADARSAFEPFTYIDMGDGMIQIDPDWVRRNIVRRPMPLLKGEVVCHRLMVDQLYGALKEIEDRGLGHLIDPSQYGGCWVPRHIDFNPSKPLSMHAWGIAADFNVSTNGLGMKPQMDPRIVAVFDRWGFVWGGRWSRPDGMHFELGALVRNSPQG